MNIRKHLLLLILSISFLLISIYTGNYYRNNTVLDLEACKKFEKTLQLKEKQARGYLEVLPGLYRLNDIDKLNGRYFQNLFETQGIELLLFDKDSLVYWSDNKVPLENETLFELPSSGIAKLKNGFYKIKSFKENSLNAFALILIKYDYPYENNYLKNKFQADFDLNDHIQIHFKKAAFNVYDSKENFVFSLQSDEKYHGFTKRQSIVLFLLYFITLMLLIGFLYRFYKSFTFTFRNPFLQSLIFSIDLIIIRVLLYYFRIPRVLYDTSLFSPDYLASSWFFPSLGDAFINVIILLIITFLMFMSLKMEYLRKTNKRIKKIIFSVILLTVSYALFFATQKVIQNLIINSSLSLNLENLFNIDPRTVIALLIFTTIYLILFFIILKGIQIFVQVIEPRKILLYPAIIIIAFAFNLVFANDIGLVSGLLFSAFIISVAFIFLTKKEIFSLSAISLFLIIFSVIATNTIFRSNELKQKGERKLFMAKISTKSDPILEYLFGELSRKFESDSSVHALKQKEDDIESIENQISGMLYQNMDSDYWNHFDIYITSCAEGKVLNIQPDDYLIDCYDYFENTIETIGDKTSAENLYYLDDHAFNKNYLGLIHIDSVYDDTEIVAFIEIFSRFIPEGLGYPELLVGNESDVNDYLKNYSFAKYINGELIYKFGNYLYSVNLDNYRIDNKLPERFSRNGYEHYSFQITDNEVMIISEKTAGFYELFSPFSYLLLLFLFYVLLFVVLTTPPDKLGFGKLNLRKRLQFFIIIIIISSFVLIGSLSVVYIVGLNNNRINGILSEKSHSVLIELEHKLAQYESLSPGLNEYLYEILNKFSQVFFTDINLYDLKGDLLASSRSRIFDEGLISSKISNEAYDKIMNENKLLYIQKESIGNYEYLSAYLPFRNMNNDIIAILNLPYFAKQDELKNEISTFITAFINVYILIFALSTFVTIVASRYITKPLQLIREKIGSLQIGKTNEKIEWEKEDEIGSLVQEYNRMLDELQRSAELLAKSEREMAWREMARQVAHEIKNPLTPMKLSVQHLKRSKQDHAAGWDKQFDKITETLIEQIDTLSSIASEFSDFAKMPVTKNERINLNQVIEHAADIYKNLENITFSFDFEREKPHWVYADKKQMLRVFNNLFENAVQALEGKEDGRIGISIKKDDDQYKIEVKDNGPGIDESIASKVFSPSFTTKSGGMGLGLALVRSIIVSSGGSISYISEKNKNTVFIIKLPASD
ncbi:MAG: GHKL domain-containing protein [Bacteroidales bacterium]|nr:GHKL domain-containing protein [Bacteroidales bacterium]MCF8345140.1 GHKL domain-containing protein [Bacteroidales bacterium]MCF8350730.1 GHKL domain-containing protein [Bacteroidales bacterium]MCF8376317.1 GHKL domain-containing protein [Bacteroidales bacterium]MCF8401010.1 GHKL domain-containing protein [Bacteroidales bacterium]